MKKYFLIITLLLSFNFVFSQDTTLVDQFVMTFTNQFVHQTPNTEPNTQYLFKVSGTYGVANQTDHMDGAYNLPPYQYMPGYYYKINGVDTYRPTPDIYNPNHLYDFVYLGDGSPILFTFQDSPYLDNSGFLIFQIYKIKSMINIVNNILTLNDNFDIEIYDMMGRIITAQTNINSINLNSYKNRLILIKIQNCKNVIFKKIYIYE